MNKQTMTLERWKLELIKIIVRCKGAGISDAIAVMEIEDVVGGYYDKGYENGSTPEEVWKSESKDIIAMCTQVLPTKGES